MRPHERLKKVLHNVDCGESEKNAVLRLRRGVFQCKVNGDHDERRNENIKKIGGRTVKNQHNFFFYPILISVFLRLYLRKRRKDSSPGSECQTRSPLRRVLI